MTIPEPPEWTTTTVMLRKHLLADGWHDRAIARMVRSGAWVRVRHGAYVEADRWRGLDDAGRHGIGVRAVLMQSKTELLPSHCSVMPFYGGPLWGFDTSWVHGTRVDGKCGRRAAGVQQHCGRLLDGDVVEQYGVQVIAPARAALEMTTLASTEAALVALNHLLHHGFTSVEEMRARYDEGIDFWKGTLRTDLVLRLATPLPESVGESRFLYRCYAGSLPAPVPQFEVKDENGRVIARLDFAWPEHGVFVEFDGRAKYSAHLRPGETPADAVVREKRREDAVVERTGWRCIRITWADLERPEVLLRRLRALLGIRHSLIA